MADIPKRIRIDDDADDEFSQEAELAIELDYDDDEKVREPINLDSHVGLADALAEANRMAPPSMQSAAPVPVETPTPPPAPAPTNRNGQAGAAAPPEPPAPRAPEPVQAAADSPKPAVDSAELEKLRADAKSANDNYLRALADLQNFRRRGEDERLRIIRDGNEKLIKEVLPILDDFDLAMGAAKQSESFEQLVDGVDAILRKFRETLSKQGVEAIEAIGQKFDPDLHEAVMLDDASEEPDETVTAELRKGYTLHNRVIRPSLVKVAKQG